MPITHDREAEAQVHEDQVMIPMTTLKELSDTILALDPDYWKCGKCGAINSTQKDGDVCPWCSE